MANTTSFTQQALAADPRFQIRLRAVLIYQALAVYAEVAPAQSVPPTAPELALMATYQARRAYARAVLADSDWAAKRVAPVLTTRTAIMAFDTTYDFASGSVVTAATDANLVTQIAADWNMYAGL